MDYFINKKGWLKWFKGWLIIDCAIRDKNIVYLCLRKDLSPEAASSVFDHNIPSELVSIFLDEERLDFRYGGVGVTGFNKPTLGVSRIPKGQGLLTARNSDGQTYVVGSGSSWPNEYIDKDSWPIIQRIKCINNYAYAVGLGRKVYKRSDIGVWVKHEKGFPKVDSSIEQGFKDIDAFSETDMYAVGGHGDIWHFDGTQWRAIVFPTNVQLNTVVCAPDGQVYIGAERGDLWSGRNTSWKRVYEGNSSLLWNDIVWFSNKLWLSSDYEFCVWDGKSLLPVEHDGQPIPITGHLDAYDGLLIIANQTEVWSFNGSAWQTIAAPY